MISNNALIILLVLIVVGFIFYFYFNCQKNEQSTPIIYNKDNKKIKKKKKVRFDDNITYNTYNKNNDETSSIPVPIIDNFASNGGDDGIDDDKLSWDSSFGIPLVGSMEQKDFITKLHNDHDNYNKSMGEFTNYQLDNQSLIKTDTTIDISSSLNKGKTIKDIYDDKVKNIKAKPKKIKYTTPNSIIYEDDNNVLGYDQDTYQRADFGDGF